VPPGFPTELPDDDADQELEEDGSDNGLDDDNVSPVCRFLPSLFTLLQMNIEETTQISKRRPKMASSSGATRKILKTDFAYPPLALFAKRCCRMATCIIDMYPENPHFSWKTFSNELERLTDEGRGTDMLEALMAIADNGDKKDELIRFVNFSYSVVCLSHDLL